MKKLIPAAVLLIVACGNPKVEIVEKQKSLKDSLEASKRRQMQAQESLEELMLHYDIRKTEDVPEIKEAENRMAKEYGVQARIKKSLDSLEVELKKY